MVCTTYMYVTKKLPLEDDEMGEQKGPKKNLVNYKTTQACTRREIKFQWRNNLLLRFGFKLVCLNLFLFKKS